MGNTNRDISLSLGQALGIAIFSPEYEILLLLHDVGEVSHKDISSMLRPSSATLDRRLAVLRARGLIESARDHVDLRRRLLSLTHKARQILDEELAFFLSWPLHQADAATAIATLINNLQTRLGVKVFDNEYRLILGIYRNGGVRTLPLLARTQMSQGNFFHKLKTLGESGLIGSIRDCENGREVRVFLSDFVTQEVDAAHAELNRLAMRLKFERATA